MEDYELDGIDDNNLFYNMATARNNKKKQRKKGYYVCLCGNDFIKAIARSQTKCPYCDRMAKMLTQMDSIEEQVQRGIWRECGTYSDKRADTKAISYQVA